mgnify:CR=1 FL=1
MQFKKNHYYKVSCDNISKFRDIGDFVIRYVGYCKISNNNPLFQILVNGFCGHDGYLYFKERNEPVPTNNNYWYINSSLLTIKKELTKEEVLAVVL